MLVEVGRFQGRHGQGAGFGPVHAGAFQPDADQLLAARFHSSRADRPAPRATCPKVEMIPLSDQIGSQFVDRGAGFAATAFQCVSQPFDQRFAASVPQPVERRLRPGVGIIRRDDFRRRMHVFADVIPVEQAGGVAELSAHLACLAAGP